ncbi:Nucleolar protein 12 [Dillenia turbinata]|uniref:Nucleolar protein 12 n=1 Tax=Dillenia turbinata TaxID=194707 RepID=A0AAN8VMB7_9MAGN
MEEEEDEQQQPTSRARHIKKRALKNKALSISFNEKDLQLDYVTGFHKRKKKRRKEAQQKLQEAQRRKRIEDRKRRKQEREYVLYGGAPPSTESGLDESGEDEEEEDETKPIASIPVATMYEHGDMQVTVITSEISREEENATGKPAAPPLSVEGAEKKHNIPVQKKQFKKVAKGKSRPKLQKRKDKKKGNQKKRKN